MERLKSSLREVLWSIRGSCWAIWSNPLTNVKWHSDPWPTVTFPTDQTFRHFHDLDTELDLHRIMSGFHGAFATGVASPAGKAYPSGHLVPSPILGLANAPIVETKFLELAMSLLDFSPRIPLGTFSILLVTKDTKLQWLPYKIN